MYIRRCDPIGVLASRYFLLRVPMFYRSIGWFRLYISDSICYEVQLWKPKK